MVLSQIIIQTLTQSQTHLIHEPLGAHLHTVINQLSDILLQKRNRVVEAFQVIPEGFGMQVFCLEDLFWKLEVYFVG
jgi:hypothetical protein